MNFKTLLGSLLVAVGAFGTAGAQTYPNKTINLATVFADPNAANTLVQLKTSDGTVKIHRKNIYRKLDIGSQAELFSLFINCIPFAEPDETSDPLQFYQQSQHSPVFASAPKR